MALLGRAFLTWLPLAVAITVLCALVFGTVQQNYRQSLNDPQIQMAEDAAVALQAGMQPAKAVPANSVDIQNSLSPWLAVYTENGAPLVSSGTLHGELPKLPQGLFDPSTWHKYAEDGIAVSIRSGEDRVTWQPESGVRQALVIVHYAGEGTAGFVVAGRNMREAENRVGVLGEMVGIGWLVAIVMSFLAELIAVYFL